MDSDHQYSNIDDTKADQDINYFDDEYIHQKLEEDDVKNGICNQNQMNRLENRQVINDIDQYDEIYDELSSTKSGKLLKNIVSSEGVGDHHIIIFDNWLECLIGNNIYSKRLTFPNGSKIVFSNLIIKEPTYNRGNEEFPLTPQMAREQGVTYGIDLWIDMIMLDENNQKFMEKGEVNTKYIKKNVHIANIPLMLKSKFCVLRGKTKMELAMYGEDPNDPGGFFIVEGNEKIVLGQEQLITDKILLLNTGGYVSSKLTVNTNGGTVVMEIYENTTNNNVHEIFLPKMKPAKSNEAKSLNILRIFRLLAQREKERLLRTDPNAFPNELSELDDPNNIKNFIMRFIKDDPNIRKKSISKLNRTLMDFNLIPNDRQVIAKNMVRTVTNPLTDAEIYEIFKSNLYPHLDKLIPINGESLEDYELRITMSKLNLLAIQEARLLEHLAGFRDLDDRDSWSNKRVEGAGRLMETLFRLSWKKTLEIQQGNIQDKGWQGTPNDLHTIATNISLSQIVTCTFRDSFIVGKWGLKGTNLKEAVAQPFVRDSVVATLANINTVDVSISRTDRNHILRLVQMSQFGFISSVATSEGKNCFPAGTLVLDGQGKSVDIATVKDNDIMLTMNKETHEISQSKVFNCFSKEVTKYEDKIYKIQLLNGKQISATSDHLFLTDKDFISLGELEVEEDKICVSYVPSYYSNDNNNPINIMNSEHFTEKLLKLDIREVTINNYIKELDSKNLLNISTDNEKMPILSRMLGYLFADGHFGINDRYPNLTGYFGCIEDADEFRKDAELIGFPMKSSFLAEGDMIEAGTGREITHSVLRVSQTGALAALFLCLGGTPGRKSTSNTEIPKWLNNSSMLVKREFLAGIIGGDGGAVRTTYTNKFSYLINQFTHSKRDGFVDNGIKFMKDLIPLFKEFEIEHTRISHKKYNLQDGNKGTTLELYFSCAADNIIRYVYNIGFRYCNDKLTRSLHVAEYLKYREYLIDNKIKERNFAIQLYEQKMSKIDISKHLGVNFGIIDNYIQRRKNQNYNPRLPKDAIKYDEWTKTTIADKGCIYIPITSITLQPNEMVYDYTTESDNHTIICSNGIVSHNCGLLKNFCITSKLTVGRDDTNIIRHLIGDEEIGLERHIALTYQESIERNYKDKIIVGAKFLGWCNGEKVRNDLVSRRRSGQFFYDMSVVKVDDYVYVDVSPSRIIRPLLLVNPKSQEQEHSADEPFLMIDVKNMREASNHELLVEGCMEYLSPWEQEYIKLAMTEDRNSDRWNAIYTSVKALNQEMILKLESELSEDKKAFDKYNNLVDFKEAQNRVQQALEIYNKAYNTRSFTHCEIDPLDLLDIAASLIPWPDHNQAPRNTYQVSMGKQALGIYHSNHLNRMNDGATKILSSPQRPLVETDMYSVIGLDNKGPGENVIQQFLALPYTEEDAFVIKKEFLDNGGLRMYKYITYKTIINKSNENWEESLGKPVLEGQYAERYADKYRYMSSNGFPMLGAPLREGDYVIGKIQKPINDNKSDPRNESVVVRVGEEGIVEKVSKSSNNGKIVVIVKLRIMRVPQEGDKYAPRNAQKGTAGLILSDEDLPYGLSGISADFTANPHSMPSRMTCAYPQEGHAAKSASMIGTHVNAGAHNPYERDKYRNDLKRYGLHEFGYEEMRSGLSGDYLEALVSCTPIFFQALRHHVKDKIQARGIGTVNPQTRQALRGRTNHGGLRFGEMERDVAIAYGASAFLKERLMGVSDEYQTVFCRVCGFFAVNNPHTNSYKTCSLCGNEDKFGRCSIPYVYKLLIHLLAAPGLNLRPELITNTEYAFKVLPKGKLTNIEEEDVEDERDIDENEEEAEDENAEDEYDTDENAEEEADNTNYYEDGGDYNF